jgi:hypothetical protein
MQLICFRFFCFFCELNKKMLHMRFHFGFWIIQVNAIIFLCWILFLYFSYKILMLFRMIFSSSTSILKLFKLKNYFRSKQKNLINKPMSKKKKLLYIYFIFKVKILLFPKTITNLFSQIETCYFRTKQEQKILIDFYFIEHTLKRYTGRKNKI